MPPLVIGDRDASANTTTTNMIAKPKWPTYTPPSPCGVQAQRKPKCPSEVHFPCSRCSSDPKEQGLRLAAGDP